jgi:hypothetical protein
MTGAVIVKAALIQKADYANQQGLHATRNVVKRNSF